MLKSILTSCAFLAAIVAPASAQSERVQEMQRVVDALNSANPLVRMATLEEVFASKDNNLKRIAMQTALESSDQSLRSAAMEAALANKSSLEISIKTFEDQNKTEFLKATNGRAKIDLHDFDASSGKFLITSELSYLRNDKLVATDGSYSGDRISFNFLITKLHNSDSDGRCIGSAKLIEGSSLLNGVMSCVNGRYGNYGIEIDLMR